MTIRDRKPIILIILIFILFLFIAKASSKPASNDMIFKVKKGSILEKALIIGDLTKDIVNPKSVSIPRLLENNEFYQDALAAKKEGMEAGYLIALEKANTTIKKQVEVYAKKNNIQFVFQESVFFEFLRLIPNFKDKTNKELRVVFDITNDILKANLNQTIVIV